MLSPFLSLSVPRHGPLGQGAHANRGRGNAFLRHIERCHCLAYVIDLSGGSSSSGSSSRGSGTKAGQVAAPKGGERSVTSRVRGSGLGGLSHDGGAHDRRGGGGDSVISGDDAEAAAKASMGAVPLPPAEQLRVLQASHTFAPLRARWVRDDYIWLQSG